MVIFCSCASAQRSISSNGGSIIFVGVVRVESLTIMDIVLPG